MQDLTMQLIERVEDARKDNKTPCNSYATRENAIKATAKMAQIAANHFAKDTSEDARPARFIVLYIESWGRWVGFIDLSEVMGRTSSTGGYLGITKGFFSY